MSIRDYRRQARAAARAIAHLAGGRIQGNKVTTQDKSRRSVLRLGDTMSNAGAAITYSGDGDSVRFC